MRELIDIIGQAIGCSFFRLYAIESKRERLAVKAVFIAIIKEEGYRSRDIISYTSEWNYSAINYAQKIFDDFIVSDKFTKELYLKAVKAVEESNYESKNDTPAA